MNPNFYLWLGQLTEAAEMLRVITSHPMTKEQMDVAGQIAFNAKLHSDSLHRELVNMEDEDE